MELAAKQDAEPEEQELVMQLSPLYLEQLEAAELNGRRDLVLRQLDRKVKGLPVEVAARVR
jgi:hypothetical protein